MRLRTNWQAGTIELLADNEHAIATVHTMTDLAVQLRRSGKMEHGEEMRHIANLGRCAVGVMEMLQALGHTIAGVDHLT